MASLEENTNLPPDIGARIRQAQGRVKNHPHAGTFVLSEENTWAAHALLIKDRHTGVEFNAGRYKAFDGILAAKLGIPALADAGHAGYAKYEGLRTNIAVLRNFILNHYHNNGTLAGSDEAAIPLLQSIASALAESLAGKDGQKNGIRSISRSLNLDIANIEGLGAAKMYAYLAEIQDKPSLWQPLVKNVKAMFSMPERKWALPPIEDSPFSMAGLAAPPPNYLMKNLPDAAPKAKPSDPNMEERVKEALASAPPPQATEPATKAPPSPLDTMVENSESIIATVNRMRSVDSLEEPTREESVEEARTILRWLRNMEFTDRDLEEFLDQGTPLAVAGKKQAVQKLVRIMAAHIHHAQLRNAGLSRDAAIVNARDAMDAMALTIAEHTRNLLPDNHPKLDRLDALIDGMPESALMRQAHPVARLLDTVEMGLERATGKEISDLSVASRLQLISERIQATSSEIELSAARTPPGREESLDLARDILSKIKSHPFSGRTIDDVVNNSTAAQKAAFAQQVSEMADAYKNLMSEAAMNNPNVLDDPKLKDANMAIQQFSYAISLMAAKEIPTSAAATQQISADVTQMPEHWGDMHNRTVDRLVKYAEGGLEKLLDDISMDQDDQQEDLMKEAIEAVLSDSDRSKRKKKKRRDSKSRTAKTYKKQRKEMLDMTADDYKLNQGRFARDALREAQHEEQRDARNVQAARDALQPIMPVVIPGIRAEDLETIRQLGGSLRSIGGQLRNLAPSVTNDKIAPDDKSAGQRTIDREQQQHNQRGPNGPRV